MNAAKALKSHKRKSLGKGEVLSSILSGSTRKPNTIGTFDRIVLFRSAVGDGTEHETRKPKSGVLVD